MHLKGVGSGVPVTPSSNWEAEKTRKLGTLPNIRIVGYVECCNLHAHDMSSTLIHVSKYFSTSVSTGSSSVCTRDSTGLRIGNRSDPSPESNKTTGT